MKSYIGIYLFTFLQFSDGQLQISDRKISI